MDSLITALVLMAVSALAAWMKKKTADNRRDSSPDAPPPPTSQPRPQRPTSWEEELRRMLEGQQPAAPPPTMRPPPAMRPAAPPPVVATTRSQIPPPAPPTVIKPVLVPSERRAVQMPPPTPSPMPAPLPVPAGVQVSAAQLAQLRQSREAYERASQLDKKVAEHIGQVSGQRVLDTRVERRSVPEEIMQVVSLFKSAQTVRQAVMASIILGPPRALEEYSAG
jgi:hypothetical protein